MKRSVLSLLGVAALAAPVVAHGVDRGNSKLVVGGKTVAVEYGRPNLQGRDMVGRAEVGSEWRMGADAATTLKTEADLSFGGVAVPKGDYVLRAKLVAADKWHLLLKQGEAVTAEVPLEKVSLDDSVETMTIDLKEAKDGGVFKLTWGTHGLKAPFTAK